MERSQIKPILESLIFVSEEPITLDLMTMVFGEQGVDKAEIREVIEELKNDWNNNPERGIYLMEVAGGYQLRTKPVMAEWIKKMNVPKPVRLSQASMETLAIVAYRQPIMRSGVEEIRGVDSGGVLKTLLERGLIRIIGKSDEVGNPLLYGTTKVFLEMFGLNNLKDLPTLKEIEDLEVYEKVGQIGKDEDAKKAIAEGVQEVINEFKDEIIAYEPDFEKIAEDNLSMYHLENSIKKLRRMEKDIFPKPKEEIQMIDKITGEIIQNISSETGESESAETADSGFDGTGLTEEFTSLEEDETTPTQNTGSVD